MGQSGHILRENGEADLDRLLTGVKQAADAIGYPYSGEQRYPSQSSGREYMTINIWEYMDKAARNFLVYLIADTENFPYDNLEKGAASIVIVDRFYDCEDMLLKFLHAYLEIFPDDLFYAESDWYYTKADIDRIVSMPYNWSWCYMRPSEQQASGSGMTRQEEALAAVCAKGVPTHRECWAQQQGHRNGTLLISKFDTGDIEHKINAFEKQYRISLPGQYRTFLRKYNGGITPDTGFCCGGNTVGEVEEFRGVGDVPVSFWDLSVKKYGKRDMLPIAYDAMGTDILLGIGDKNRGKVFYGPYGSGIYFEWYEWEDFRTFLACCHSRKIRTVEEREAEMVAAGHLVTEGSRRCWQEEIDWYNKLELEELEVLLDQAVEMLTKAENFVLTGIYKVDGHERFAGIKRMDAHSEQFTVHFLEYDEYLEDSTVSRKRREGDVLEGRLLIELVTGERKTEGELMHRQPIQLSPHIEAVVKVCQVVDNYSVLAMSTVAEEQILVEFEHIVDYKSGDRIYLEGSLELKITEECDHS